MIRDEAIEKCRKLDALEKGSLFPGERNQARILKRRIMQRHLIAAKDLQAPKPEPEPRLSAAREKELAERFVQNLVRRTAKRFGEELAKSLFT